MPFLGNISLFKKLFILTFMVAVIPIGLSFLYFFYLDGNISEVSDSNLSVVYYGLILILILLAAVGAYYFNRHISKPITDFTRSATEIARGNFSQKVIVESKDEIGRLAKIFNYMVKELRRLNQMNLNQIINEKNKTEAILKNIADGVIVTDANNKILMMNTVAEKWFSLIETDWAEKSTEIVKNKALVDFIEEINGNKNDKTLGIEIPLESRDGWLQVILQARAARISDEKGELVGIVTILRDITREKEVDRLKTELVSMVAHELRSPLTSISGFSELLLDNNITRPQSEEYATIILKESNRLNDLINKFLDISKIEAGKSQLRWTPVDIKMLVRKVLDFNARLADKKQIEVQFEAPDEISTIQVDQDMIEQAILNLFSNAVKYSPEKAKVTVRVIENEKTMNLEIEDTGYGISEKSLPHIFTKFYRITDNEKVRDVMGSGLGLALVKEIVEVHNGQIKVCSRLGKGSTFTIKLPKEIPVNVQRV